MQFDRNKLEEGVEYICLAMAGEGSTESRAFRALYPVTLMDDSAPGIKNVVHGLYTDDDGVTVSGTITVQLSKPLYRYGVTDPKKLFPVKHSPDQNPETGGKIGFGTNIRLSDSTHMKITPSEEAPIDSVQITVTKVPSKSLTITFVGDVFYSKSGTPMKGATVQVRVVDAVNGEFMITF